MKSFLRSIVNSDTLERAFWTFAQTFVAVWALSDFQLSKVAVIGALGAGLSAIKTFVKSTL